MRRKDTGRALGDFVDLLHEHRTLGLEVFDHKAVVDDLVPHVDRCAQRIERALHNFNRAVYTSAEPTGVGEQDLHGFQLIPLVPPRFHSSSMSRMSSAAPTEIAASATLNAAKCQLPT